MKRATRAEPPRTASLLALQGVIAALRAGAPPEMAWEEWPEAVVASDGTVTVPGDPHSSASLTAASRLARTMGAPLSEVLDVVSAVLRDEAEAALRRESALAGPRASATVLSWLPLVGVAMGGLVESTSVRLLVASLVGWVLLTLAAGLWWVGRRWMRALVDRAAAAGQAR